ncbi:MAG: hypothetical protein GTN93_24175, partial [Anaerolineae bacterium]|nr:hypothetical protein [Anaerolineae bacterium]
TNSSAGAKAPAAAASAANSALDVYGYSASASVAAPNVDKIMNDLNINAACMASANSVILVCIDNKLYWYRGVRLPGLMNMANSVPAYGDDVTHLFTVDSLQAWAKAASAGASPQLWPSTSDKNDKRVFWRGQMVNVATVMEELAQMDIDGLTKAVNDIIDFLTQVSV